MENKRFYYSKWKGCAVFLSSFLLTIALYSSNKLGSITIPVFCLIVFTISLLTVFNFFLVFKWLIPAFLKQEAFTLDDNDINLKNSTASIPWRDIDFIKYKQRQFGDAIIIKLKPHSKIQSLPKFWPKAKLTKLLQTAYGYNYSIPVIMIKGDPNKIFGAIVEQYNYSK